MNPRSLALVLVFCVAFSSSLSINQDAANPSQVVPQTKPTEDHNADVVDVVTGVDGGDESVAKGDQISKESDNNIPVASFDNIASAARSADTLPPAEHRQGVQYPPLGNYQQSVGGGNKIAPLDAVMGGISRAASALTTSVSLAAHFNQFYQRVSTGFNNVFGGFRHRYYSHGFEDIFGLLKENFGRVYSRFRKTSPPNAYTDVIDRALEVGSGRAQFEETDRQTLTSGVETLLGAFLDSSMTNPMHWFFASAVVYILVAVAIAMLNRDEFLGALDQGIGAFDYATGNTGGRSIPDYVLRRAENVEKLPQLPSAAA